MRVPCVKFTVRRIMVAVAIVATLLAGGIEAARMSRLARTYQQKATQYALSEAINRRNIRTFEHLKIKDKGRDRPEGYALFHRLARESAVRVNYCAALKAKYADAAAHPWRHVPPDPPRP